MGKKQEKGKIQQLLFWSGLLLFCLVIFIFYIVKDTGKGKAERLEPSSMIVTEDTEKGDLDLPSGVVEE